MTATWQPNPFVTDYQDDHLVDDDGTHLARIEDFGMGVCYPSAINAATGNLERGGPHKDPVEAMQWCERVAGIHPVKPGDERPPFYYTNKEDK